MIAQLFVNGVILASMYALLGISWGIIFNVANTFHFAGALTYLLAGYVAVYTYDKLGLPFPLAFILAIAVAVLFGIVVEIVLYRPLRRLFATPLAILIASLGLLIIGENVILLVFGTVPIAMTRLHISLYSFGSINFANTHLIATVICIVVVVLYILFLNLTTTGKAMVATANNPQMAEVVGINISRIYLLTFVVGSTLAGVAGFLYSMTHAASLPMGMEMVLVAFMATLMGGVGHLWGAVIAGIIMGMVQSFAILAIGSQWQLAVLYLLLIIVIVVRPRGIFGVKVIQTGL